MNKLFTIYNIMFIKKLKEYIRNNITITIYNIHFFINLDIYNKKIIMKYAKKYNHEDIIKLLQK